MLKACFEILTNKHRTLKFSQFRNDNPTSHAQWVVVETRPLRGSGQPAIRCMLRHNAIEAWETMKMSGGKRTSELMESGLQR